MNEELSFYLRYSKVGILTLTFRLKQNERVTPQGPYPSRAVLLPGPYPLQGHIPEDHIPPGLYRAQGNTPPRTIPPKDNTPPECTPSSAKELK